jgi:hypothetical protein
MCGQIHLETEAWHSQSAKEVLAQLVSSADGLSSQVAALLVLEMVKLVRNKNSLQGAPPATGGRVTPHSQSPPMA